MSKADNNRRLNVQILWVDDDLSHNDVALNMVKDSLIKNFSITVMHPIEFKKQFENIRDNDFDLFLVDYCLNQISYNGEIYDGFGLELAGKIKGSFPDYPVYVVSCIEDEGVFGREAQPAKNTFDKVLTFEQVENGALMLYWDAKYYDNIRKIAPNDIEALLDLLKPPKKVRDRIKVVLPDDIRNGLFTKIEGNPIAFGRWVQNKLINLPGFLYDDLYAATQLGMSKDYFLKIEKEFNSAKYHGIFSEYNKDLWWVTELNKIVYSSPKVAKLKFDYTWELAPHIFNVPEKDRSRCVVCKDKYPETVGINIKRKNQMEPVHYRCSEPYQLIKTELFFDEIRGYIPK